MKVHAYAMGFYLEDKTSEKVLDIQSNLYQNGSWHTQHISRVLSIMSDVIKLVSTLFILIHCHSLTLHVKCDMMC